jgi:hypothetical protein
MLHMSFADELLRSSDAVATGINLSDPVTLAVGLLIIFVVVMLGVVTISLSYRSRQQHTSARRNAGEVKEAAGEVKEAADLAEKAAARAKEVAEQAVRAATEAVQAANTWEISGEALEQSKSAMHRALLLLDPSAGAELLKEQDTEKRRAIQAQQNVREDARTVKTKAEEAMRLADDAVGHASMAQKHAETAKAKAQGKAVVAAEKAIEAARNAKDAATKARLSAEATRDHADAVLQAKDPVTGEVEAADANSSGVMTVRNLEQAGDEAKKAQESADEVVQDDERR